MEQMTRWERVRAALQGAEVDRAPMSLWRHFYDQETSTEGLVSAMLGWQERWGWDYAKINPRAEYHSEPWGARYQYSRSPLAKHQLLASPIRTSDDWRTIKSLPPEAGAFGEHLRALRLLRDRLAGQVPFIMTVFTPLSVAGDLAGSDERLRQDLDRDPAAVEAALDAIAETLRRYTTACLEAGADGIFFATTTWATTNIISEAEYGRFGRPFDLKVLAGAHGASFNVLHVCQDHNLLFALADYPVQAVNWAVRAPGNPSLSEFQARLPARAAIGGVEPAALRAETPESAMAQVEEALRQTGGRRWLLGGDCTIPSDSRPENVEAVRRVIGG